MVSSISRLCDGNGCVCIGLFLMYDTYVSSYRIGMEIHVGKSNLRLSGERMPKNIVEHALSQ